MPNKVRGRPTGIAVAGGLLADGGRAPKMCLRKACLSASRGVEDGTPKSRRSYGRIDAPFGCAMPANSGPFVVARNTCIVPKQRCIEPLPSGYSIREFHNHSQGRYWYVITALEVIPTKRRGRNRI
jgi:hypothetical protein